MTKNIIREAESIDVFLSRIRQQNPNANLALISKAYEFAKSAHQGQKRASGDDFFIHPVEVAKTLVEMNADSASICAALLHDVLEDTKIKEDTLKTEFGDEINELVKGVTKTESIHFSSKEDYNAENIRKIILATAKDVRVILIKLADRLHNMRTLKYIPEQGQIKFSKETLEIYAPIAYKLGVYRIKAELEDLSLRFLQPEIYQELKQKINLKKEYREKEISKIIDKVKNTLKENSIQAEVFGRPKHFYSIYKKMISRNRSFDDIHDLYAIRIITETKEDCYHILGLVHEIWRPIPNGFQDYIANPKPNMYQSIHTEIIFEGHPIEIQIRTLEMHYSAEDGIAAHWRYKGTDRDKKFDQKITWLKHILNWKQAPTGKEFIETLKIDLFGKDIIVFTPKGDPINLPEGSTPIDFAYSVHTDIGNHCSKAKVNNDIVPLDHSLKSGDIVEIITAKNAVPSRNWLKFARSSIAKSEIRQALKIKGIIRDEDEEEERDAMLWRSIEILDNVKAPVKLSKCCSPKLKDSIAAYYTKDKKITVHRADCPNVRILEDAHAKKINVKWSDKDDTKTNNLLVIVNDRVGLLAEILNILAAEKINIQSINTDSSKEKIRINIKVQCSDVVLLNKVASVIRRVESVNNVHVIEDKV